MVKRPFDISFTSRAMFFEASANIGKFGLHVSANRHLTSLLSLSARTKLAKLENAIDTTMSAFSNDFLNIVSFHLLAGQKVCFVNCAVTMTKAEYEHLIDEVMLRTHRHLGITT